MFGFQGDPPGTNPEIRGDVANLADGGGTVDLGAVVRLDDDSIDATTRGHEDPLDPAPGQAFLSLYRGRGGDLAGSGTRGDGSGGALRVPAAGECPDTP